MAMSRLARDEIDPDVTCSVCHEVYTSPRLLPCFHTFCLTCIQGLATKHGTTFPCPQCRKTTRIPSSGPRGFQVNFYIKEEDLDLARKGHTICPVHSKDKKRLVLFCKECDLLLCTRCKLTKHEGHSTEDLYTAAAECAQKLTSFKDTIETNLIILESESQKIQYELQSLNRKETAFREKVKSKRDLLVARLDRAVEVVLRDLESTSREAQQGVTREATIISMDLAFDKQLCRQVDQALAGTDADKLSTEKSLRQLRVTRERERFNTKPVRVPTSMPELDSGVDISDAKLLELIGKPRNLMSPPTFPTWLTIMKPHDSNFFNGNITQKHIFLDSDLDSDSDSRIFIF